LKAFDTGNIFVYNYSKSAEEFQLVNFKDLKGDLLPGSRFGASLANLGFLDKDIFMDFAVGAPFAGANHEGAVFIYHGRSNLNFEGK